MGCLPKVTQQINGRAKPKALVPHLPVQEAATRSPAQGRSEALTAPGYTSKSLISSLVWAVAAAARAPWHGWPLPTARRAWKTHRDSHRWPTLRALRRRGPGGLVLSDSSPRSLLPCHLRNLRTLLPLVSGSDALSGLGKSDDEGGNSSQSRVLPLLAFLLLLLVESPVPAGSQLLGKPHFEVLCSEDLKRSVRAYRGLAGLTCAVRAELRSGRGSGESGHSPPLWVGHSRA